jgi:hypothetical protein
MSESPQPQDSDYEPAEDPDSGPPATEQTVQDDEHRDQAEGADD